MASRAAKIIVQCAAHGGIELKLEELSKDVDMIKKTLVGEDFRGGMVADVAEMKNSVGQLLVYMEEQKRNEIDRKKSDKDQKLTIAEWSFRKKILIYSSLLGLATTVLVMIIEHFLTGGL